MMRARSRIKPEIGDEQYGFVENRDTRNIIFMVWMLFERAIEQPKDFYMCFIDYSKAFYKVKHEELFQLMEGIDLDGKDIHILRKLYLEQAACMKTNNETCEYIKTERGVQQDCVFSLDLFNLYSEIILGDLEL